MTFEQEIEYCENHCRECDGQLKTHDNFGRVVKDGLKLVDAFQTGAYHCDEHFSEGK